MTQPQSASVVRTRKSEKISILWHWVTMGPYHFARMRALQNRLGITLRVAETSNLDDHQWSRGDEVHEINIIPLALNGPRPNWGDYYSVLKMIRPTIIVAPGYSDLQFLASLTKYREERPDSLAVLWSESTAVDHWRNTVVEGVKAVCVSAFDGALVAGNRHAEYLQQLGMSADRIGIVGNCVDNNYFSSRVSSLRCSSRGTPSNSFLFVGRLIPEKNLSGLIEAYRRYRRRAMKEPWSLVIVGGGPLEIVLKEDVRTRSIEGVAFAGLRQPSELTEYYAHAGCFVLPSTSEPWGLVVNEAMACGLPVLVSKRCGCAPDLVKEGRNGFVFDPGDVDKLASLMERVSNGDLLLGELGNQSRNIISEFTPEAFAERTETHFRSLLNIETVVRHPWRQRMIRTVATAWRMRPLTQTP